MPPGRSLTLPVLAAVLVAGCGGEDTFSQRSVAEVIAAEPGTLDEPLAVEGRAYPVADVGFALAGDEAAVLVTALPTEVAKLSDGERVRVQGRVEEIGAGLATRLDQEKHRPRGLGLPGEIQAELELDQGAPVIANPSISGEDRGG